MTLLERLRTGLATKDRHEAADYIEALEAKLAALLPQEPAVETAPEPQPEQPQG